MKIKLKVKHLVMTLLGLLLVIPLAMFLIVPQVQLYMGGKQLAAGEAGGKEKIAQVLERSLFPEQRWNLIREYMIDDGGPQQFDVYVGPSFTQVSNQSVEMKFTWDEKLPYLKEYLADGPLDGYLVSVARQLGYFYQREGRFEKADEVFIQAAERYSGSTYQVYRNELNLERIKLRILQSDYRFATELIDEMKQAIEPEDYHMWGSLVHLETQVYMKEGKQEEAYQLVTQELAEYKQKWEEEKEVHPEDEEEWIPVALEQLESIKNEIERAIEQQRDGMTTVKGRVVRSTGEAVPNVGVFLRKEDSVHRSLMEDEPYQLVTDQQGNFEFTGVIPGNYQLNLGLTFEQIDGWTWPVEMEDWIIISGQETEKLEVTLHPLLELEAPVNQAEIKTNTMEFAWEPVEGAAYYDLHLGVESESGSVSTVFKTRIEGNRLTVPLEELYNQQVGVMFEDSEDWTTVDPVSILAFTNTENKFSWSVKAYRQDGEMITQSNGYRLDEESIGNLPFFYLKAREMTEADQLFLAKKVKQALAKYKEDYAENPNDSHSLRMIVRMIGIEAAHSERTREEVALPYLLKWAEISNSPDAAYELAAYYHKKRDWEEYHRWYGRYLQLMGDETSGYTEGVHATALMKQLKMAEAREAFRKYIEVDKGNRFIGNWLAVELYVNKNETYDGIRELARKYPELGNGDHDWARIIGDMMTESEDFPDYNQELKHTLELYFNEDEGSLNQWLETTDKKQLKRFIYALREVN